MAMTDPVDQLCDSCATYFDEHAQWLVDGIGRKVKAPLLVDVRNAADHGCHLCTSILQALNLAANPGHIPRETYYQSDEGKIVLTDVSVVKDKITDELRLEIGLTVDGHERKPAVIWLHPVTPENVVTAGSPMEHEIPYSRPSVAASTRSEQTLTQIKKWSIDSKRLGMGKKWDRSTLPARLIHVGDQSDMDCVCLVASSEVPADCDFITVSYCWGSTDFMRLTSQTKEDMENGIQISLLPQTFKDAIYLARELGIHYVWIDALCIIQDCYEDFSREAREMSTLYRRSWLTLAAIDSVDCTGGLFRERQSRAALPCIIEPQWKCFSRRSVYAYHQGHIEEVTDATFFRRGWILQELILSARIVCFGACQVYWLSQSGYMTEAFPEVLPRSRNNFVRRLLYHFNKHHVFCPQEPNFEKIMSTWSTIVESYCKKALTFNNDKLIALSGLADYVSDATKGELRRYSAGMWETAIEQQLTWTVRDGYQQARPRRNIPTWSWAAIDCDPGGLSFPLVEQHKPQAVQCHVEMTYLQAPLLIPVRSRSECDCLRIRAPFASIVVKEHEFRFTTFKSSDKDDNKAHDYSNNSNGHNEKTQCNTSAVCPIILLDQSSTTYPSSHWSITWDAVDHISQASTSHLSAVLVSDFPSHGHGEATALLLTPVENQCCRYTRAGVLRMRARDGVEGVKMSEHFVKPSMQGMACLAKGKTCTEKTFWEIV